MVNSRYEIQKLLIVYEKKNLKYVCNVEQNNLIEDEICNEIRKLISMVRRDISCLGLRMIDTFMAYMST
jgi:hypothetical protein